MSIEDFQNEVIRPAIKSKNDFIIQYITHYFQANKITFSNEIDKRNKIENILKTDIKLKNIFIGAIISNFNESELAEFQSNKTECSKRIVNIIAKRIFDNW